MANPRLYGTRLENTLAKHQKREKQRSVKERQRCSVVLGEEAHLRATGGGKIMPENDIESGGAAGDKQQ